jgi:hypothetical protein
MKGINFKEPLFHQVVSGEKTQTRRIIKPQPVTVFYGTPVAKCNNQTGVTDIRSRYRPGETLYLKEPYHNPDDFPVTYKYDGFYGDKIRWQNKLFMPARYARYFIEITGVRVERLRDIRINDCFKEGVNQITNHGINPPYSKSITYYNYGISGKEPDSRPRFKTAIEAYAALIDSINGKGTWESNPFVWVYDFKLTTK